MDSLFKRSARRDNMPQLMRTQRLPVPGQPADDLHFVYFTAKVNETGIWEIKGYHSDGAEQLPGLHRVISAFLKTIRQYHRNPPENITNVTSACFDDAYLILRAIEDSVEKHLGLPPRPEPEGHFMQAYRQLADTEKVRLDGLYFSILRENGPVLPPQKLPRGPKPGF